MSKVLYKLYKKITIIRLLFRPHIFIKSFFVSKNILNTDNDLYIAFRAIESQLRDSKQLGYYLYHNNQVLKNVDNLRFLLKSFRDNNYFAKNDLNNTDTVKQICFIGNMGIGNFLHMMPLLKEIKKNYPTAQVIVIFTKKSPLIKLVDTIEEIDSCLVFNEGFDKENLYCYEFYDFLKFHKISPQIIFTRFTRNNYAQLLNLIYPEADRVGHCSSAGFECPLTDITLSHKVDMDIMEHEIIRNLNLLQPLKINFDITNISIPNFQISTQDNYQAEKIMRDNKIYGEKILFFCPGTSIEQTFKRWNIDNWINLLILLKDKGYKLVLLGSKDDQNYSKKIISEGMLKDKSFKNIINLCGETSLNELFSILSYGSLFIGLNSGMTHIANILGIKSVSIMLSTDNPRTNPYYNNRYYHKEIDSNKIAISIIPDCSCWDDKYVTNLDKSVFNKLLNCSCINKISPSKVNTAIDSII